MDPLNTIRAQIERGEFHKARRALVSFVNQHPDSIPAWTLLADLVPDRAQQLHCHRRILDLDPANTQAAVAVQRLTEGSHQPGDTLRCPQCGGRLVVHLVGEMKDKRATCRHCGTEIDLPDAYRRVEHQHEHERHPTHTRTVDKTVIETRSDNQRDTSEDQAVRRTQQWSTEKRVEQTVEQESVQGRVWPALFGRLRGQQVAASDDPTASQQDKDHLLLSPEELIEAAGGPLPPEERRKCPECGTTIAKQASHCGWCGTRFSES